MSEALLYQVTGRQQVHPNGFGKEHHAEYLRYTRSLVQGVTAGSHIPELHQCEYCGYETNIRQGWAVTIHPGNTEGLPAGVYAVGGTCLDTMCPRLEVLPNYGVVTSYTAKKIMARRLDAVQELQTFRDAHKATSARYAESNLRHWLSLKTALTVGDKLSDVCTLLHTWQMRDLYYTPAKAEVPLPCAYAKATKAVISALKQYTGVAELPGIAILRALFGLDASYKRMKEPPRSVPVPAGELSNCNDLARWLRGRGL